MGPTARSIFKRLQQHCVEYILLHIDDKEDVMVKIFKNLAKRYHLLSIDFYYDQYMYIMSPYLPSSWVMNKTIKIYGIIMMSILSQEGPMTNWQEWCVELKAFKITLSYWNNKWTSKAVHQMHLSLFIKTLLIIYLLFAKYSHSK